MNDLLNRLQRIDPVSEERLAGALPAIDDLPGRIVSHGGDPTGRRLRASVRALAIAAVLLAIAVPLVWLRPLSHQPAGPSSTWVRAGRLDRIRTHGVVYLPGSGIFVVAPVHGSPYALSSRSVYVNGGDGRALYCRSSGWFIGPQGERYDQRGRYERGPAISGLGRVQLRVVDGVVEVDPGAVAPGPPRTTPADAAPNGRHCAANPLSESRPGFALLHPYGFDCTCTPSPEADPASPEPKRRKA